MHDNFFYALERPLHLLPSNSQVRSRNLQNFPQLIQRLGGNHLHILDLHGINPSVIEATESFVDCQAFADMFEYCAAKFNDQLFGLHLAQLQEADTYGMVTVLCRSAATVREAIHCLIEFLPILHSTESILTLVEGEKISELRWNERSNLGSNNQSNIQGLMLNLKVLKLLWGTKLAPSYVCLPAEMFKKINSELESEIGCPVRFSQARSCIAFPTDFLNILLTSANHPLFQLLYGYMERLKASQSQTVVDKVKSYVLDFMSSGEVSIEACAKNMGMSSRTLQLRLTDHGMKFSDVLEGHRLERAKYILEKNELSIAQVADLLGYSERTSFGRAFKRWTGLSPQQYRDKKFN